MNGWIHAIVGLSFLIGMVFVDADHVKSCSVQQLKEAFNGHDNTCKRGILHNPVILLCLIALTIGFALHLKMDNLI